METLDVRSEDCSWLTIWLRISYSPVICQNVEFRFSGGSIFRAFPDTLVPLSFHAFL